MITAQCIYCEKTFRTHDEERDWCDDCEDDAVDIRSFKGLDICDRGGTGHGDDSFSDTDPGL